MFEQDGEACAAQMVVAVAALHVFLQANLTGYVDQQFRLCPSLRRSCKVVQDSSAWWLIIKPSLLQAYQ